MIFAGWMITHWNFSAPLWRIDKMSDYRKETEAKLNLKIEELLKDVPQFVSSYILSISVNTSASTRLEYLRDIKRFLSYIMESYTDAKINSITDITLDIIESLDVDFLNSYSLYLKTYMKNGKIRTNSDVAISRKQSSIRSMYAFLYSNDKIKSNPMVKVASPKIKTNSIIYMENDETKDFLNAVASGGTNKMQAAYHNKQKIRDYALISLLLSTGLRVSECVGLDIKDIDFKHYEIRLIRKGGRKDKIYMSDSLAAIMDEYVQFRKLQTALPSHEDALFLSSQKKRMGVRAVEKLVEKYREQAALSKHITPHKLRSTYGTNLYEVTGDLYLVAELLGHKSVETTKSHYANISNKYKFDNRNRLEDSEKFAINKNTNIEDINEN